jgi:hypothetical protein
MTTTPTLRTHAVLKRVETNRLAVRSAEFERLVLAREWALAHVITDPDVIASRTRWVRRRSSSTSTPERSSQPPWSCTRLPDDT